ncbi:hypothetical protein [Streptomyces sp. NPDC052042]|uniref:hypothetical protein n=1 Tax=Streptomyces sp. NPDC052042 TaxID=3365683 RepID=UPI0037D3E095
MRTVLRSSYSKHWRRMLSPLLDVLELKRNNTAYRPVMDASRTIPRLSCGGVPGPAAMQSYLTDRS